MPKRSSARGFRRQILTVLAVLVAVFPAAAQPPLESADELFVRARALMKAGDYADALPLLERSHALEPTLGTRFNMAICESRVGKLIQAREHLTSVIEESPREDARRVHAERALNELSPRIPHLVLELDDPRQELELVRLDDETLSEIEPNEPYPIDPGTHELEVVVARQAPQRRTFRVAERQMYTWSLGRRFATESKPVVRDDRATPPALKGEFWTTRRTAAVVAGGASLASFGIAVGFVFSARSIYSSSEQYCNANDVCESEGVERRDHAREHGRIATVAATVGVAAAAAGVTLWLTGSQDSDAAHSIRVGFRGGVAGARDSALVLQGSY
jgi:hypothetical protein